jgi:hypothetical protein
MHGRAECIDVLCCYYGGEGGAGLSIQGASLKGSGHAVSASGMKTTKTEPWCGTLAENLPPVARPCRKRLASSTLPVLVPSLS